MHLFKKLRSTLWLRRRAVVSSFVMALGLLASGSSHALADEATHHSYIDDRWFIGAGGFLADFKTDASIGSGNVVGAVVQLEDDLGLSDNDSQFRLDGHYRFNRRHAFGYGYWDLQRTGSEVLMRRIEVGDRIYDVDATLISRFDSQWIRADWRYSFMRNPNGEAGMAVGISAYDFNLALEGEACLDPGDGCTMFEQAKVEQDILAPVPTLGFFINYAIKPKLLFRTSFNFFKLNTGNYEGRVVDGTALFEWYFTRHFGLGGGMNGTNIDVKNTGKDPFTVNYEISGLLAYVSFTWGGNLKN